MEKTKQAHTPGPLGVAFDSTGVHLEYWETEKDREDGSGYPLDELDQDTKEANCWRLVALWNAFDGIPTEEIPAKMYLFGAHVALKAENARLRGALEPFTKVGKHFDYEGTCHKDSDLHDVWVTVGDIRRARTALSAEEEK